METKTVYRLYSIAGVLLGNIQNLATKNRKDGILNKQLTGKWHCIIMANFDLSITFNYLIK